ncbi:MAG: hypothetical protein WC734_04030 [Patescibacteria group bacterium]|jgi:hypothetical protein
MYQKLFDLIQPDTPVAVAEWAIAEAREFYGLESAGLLVLEGENIFGEQSTIQFIHFRSRKSAAGSLSGRVVVRWDDSAQRWVAVVVDIDSDRAVGFGHWYEGNCFWVCMKAVTPRSKLSQPDSAAVEAGHERALV